MWGGFWIAIRQGLAEFDISGFGLSRVGFLQFLDLVVWF